jgi:3-oxoadipate enol-lactonase
MPFADLTDVRCRYEIMGHGDPLLMIVGLGCTVEKWGNITDELASSFTLILVDNRDMGESAAKRTPQSLSDLAADFVELMDYLQLDRTHLLGLSLGGIIAQRLAIDHPSRINKLVLLSCTYRFGPYLHEMAKLLEQSLRKFPYEMFRRTIEVLGTSPEYFDAHADEIERDLKSTCDSVEHRSAIARQLWCLGCNDVASANDYHIQAPTLVIAGERDMLIPPIYARQMADAIPNSEFMAIPACGHNPLVEKPLIAIPRIMEFLLRTHSEDHNDTEIQHVIHEVMEAMQGVA